MNKLLPIVLLAACAEQGPAVATYEPPQAPVAFTTLGGWVATGGYQVVTISDASQAGLSGRASEGFDVEPVGGAWPNLVAPEYHVRALTSGEGTFAIETSHGAASGAVHSAEVARVQLVPPDYALDGHSAFAVDASRATLEIRLTDADGDVLVDGSVRAPGQTAWNELTVAHTGAVTITGDSFAPVTVQLAVVDGVDRIEAVTADGVTCRHAYRGDVEVVTAATQVKHPTVAINCD